MHPKHRTLHIPQPIMQPITIPEVNSSHTRPPPPIITPIIGLDLILPVLAYLAGTILAKPNIDQEIAILIAGLEIGRCIVGRPLIDAAAEQLRRVPTPETAGAVGFVVERCAEGDYAKDLRWYVSI